MTDSPGTPDVCIGILTLNGPERLARALDSIRKHTPLEAMNAKVFVSDDCSFETNLEANKRVCGNFGVEMIMSDRRLGVATQWNRLTRHTRAPVMVIVSDDVEVVQDWLEALVFTIKQNPHAGVVGLKGYEGVNTLNFTPPHIRSYNEAVMERGHGMLAPTGFLFGFARDKFDAIGGADENFFCFYEDIDLGVRMLKKGWPSYMLSYPIVIHQGGATTSDRRNLDSGKFMAESKAKFMAKHGSLQLLRETLCSPMFEESLPARRIQWNTMLKTWTD